MKFILSNSFLFLITFVFCNIFCNSTLANTATDLDNTENIISHKITMGLNPSKEFIYMSDVFPASLRPQKIKITSQAFFIEISLGNEIIPYTFEEKNEVQTLTPIYPDSSKKITSLESLKIRYKLKNQKDSETLVISDEGIYLSSSSYWYPYVNTNYENFKLTVELPKDWSSITSGELINQFNGEESKTEMWQIDYPSESIDFVANRFLITEELYKGVLLQTYFRAPLQQYAAQYIEKMKYYFDLHSNYFGSYPFKKFAVVGNFLPTGFGMPSYTLIGENLIPLSFMLPRSLGHEFLHNYWGNSIYVKEEQGNWCEGLTTYQGDYYYENLKGQESAKSHRLDVLRGYQNFVRPENVFPVNRFHYRYDEPSQAIGYGKAMMIFHMIEERIGTDFFNKALQEIVKTRTFQETGWSDFQNIFEKISNQNLKTFFEQWLQRTDVLDLNLNFSEKDSLYLIELNQKTTTPYETQVPIRFIFDDGSSLDRILFISELNKTFTFSKTDFPKNLIRVDLDPDFHLMRTLTEKENPPTLAKAWGSKIFEYKSSLPTSNSLEEALNKIISSYPSILPKESKVTFFNPEIASTVDQSSLFFLTLNQVDMTFYKTLLTTENNFSFKDNKILFPFIKKEFDLNNSVVVLSSSYQGKTLIFIIGPTQESILNIAPKISHYKKSSYLVFSLEGKKILDGVW